MNLSEILDIIDVDLDFIRFLVHEQGGNTSNIHHFFFMQSTLIQSINNNPFYPTEVQNENISMVELNEQSAHGIVIEICNGFVTKTIFNLNKPPFPLIVNEIQPNQEVIQSFILEE